MNQTTVLVLESHPKAFFIIDFFFLFFYHLNTVCDCNFVETVSSSWRPGKKSEALTFGTLFIVDSFKLPHRTSPMSISTEFSLTLHLDCMLDKRKAFAWWSERHLVMPGSFHLLRLSSAHLTRQLQINLLTVVILFEPFHWNLHGFGVSHSSVRTGYNQGCLHSLGPPDHQGASWFKKKNRSAEKAHLIVIWQSQGASTCWGIETAIYVTKLGN